MKSTTDIIGKIWTGGIEIAVGYIGDDFMLSQTTVRYKKNEDEYGYLKVDMKSKKIKLPLRELAKL